MVTVCRVSNRLGKLIFSVEKLRSDSSASRRSSSAAIASGPEASTDIFSLLEFPDIVPPASIWFSELLTSASHQFERNLRHSTVSITTISFSANCHPVIVHQVSGASYYVKYVEYVVTVHTLLFLSQLFVRLLTRYTASTNYTPICPPVLINSGSGASRVVVYALLFKHRADFSGLCVRFLLVLRLRCRILLGILVVLPHSRLFLQIDRLFNRFQSCSSVIMPILWISLGCSSAISTAVSIVTHDACGLGSIDMRVVSLRLKIQLMLLYGYSPRPPEICSASCLWLRFTTLVCLWSLLSFCHHPVPGHLSIHNDVAVLSYLENRYSRRQGEFWFERYKRNLDFGIVRRWLAFWTDNHVLSLTKSDLQLSLSECIKDTLILINYLCNLTSFCLFLKTYDGFFVALRMLYGAQTVTKLLCVSLVYTSIRDGLQELLRLIQQTDNSFEHWFFLLASHRSYNSKHGEFWLLALQDAYVICVPEDHFYSSHHFCSHNYNLNLLSTSRVMQKLQKIWTKTRLFLSLLQSRILVLSTFTGTSTALRVVGLHCFSVGFLYGSLPRPPEDHHQAFHRFHYTAGFCYGLLTLLEILSSVFRVFLPQQSQDCVFFGRLLVAISRCFGTMLAIPFGSLPRPPEFFVQLILLLSFFCCFSCPR